MADSKDDRILVAMRTDMAQYHVVGTKHGYYKCSRCDRELSVSPAGQKFLRDNPEVQVVCMECAMKETPDSVEPAPGAIEELIEDRLRRARHTFN